MFQKINPPAVHLFSSHIDRISTRYSAISNLLISPTVATSPQPWR